MNHKEGWEKVKQVISSRMLKKGGVSASYISEMTQLSQDAVRKLAESTGAAVP